MKIYHIVLPEVWEKFSGSQFETESLTTERFIHCSFAEQIDTVLDRICRDQKNVTILEIDASKLTSKLVVEPSTNGEDYPHIYGPINIDAIVGVERRKRS